MFEAKVIEDSINEVSIRLTTMQLTHPRIVHSEFMTHGSFARNASSSRAIPLNKLVGSVIDDPFIPVVFPKNQPGMQGFEYLANMELDQAKGVWLRARNEAVMAANELHSLGVHKQICNRLIEPWSWITVCCTGDQAAWANYFSLRCHKDAEDNLQKQAFMAQLEYAKSKPRQLKTGEWHTPYVNDAERKGYDPFTLLRISAGRCARTSYLTQEGKRDIGEDLKLHDRLRDHRPMHASPLEHVCQAQALRIRLPKFISWLCYRHTLPDESARTFKWNHPELLEASNGSTQN